MKKNFKRFISTMLVACMALSMVASAQGEQSEANNQIETNIVKSVQDQISGEQLEISEIGDMYYYFNATSERVVTMGYNTITADLEVCTRETNSEELYEGRIADFGNGDKSAEQIFEDALQMLSSNEIEFNPVTIITTSEISTYDSVESSLTSQLIAKHGPATNKVLQITAGPSSSTGVLSQSLSFRVTNSGQTISVGASIVGLSGLFKIAQSELSRVLKNILNSSGVVTVVALVLYYQATAMFTKTVHVNETYQYYAGKDITYGSVAFLGEHTSIGISTTTAHPDFEDNNALMQKGFNNYFM